MQAVFSGKPTSRVGDPHEGATLHLAGLTAVPPGLGANLVLAGSSQGAICQIVDALFLAIDPDLGALFSTCDANAGVWESLGSFPAALRCTQIKFDYEDGNLWLSVVESGKQHLYKLDPFTFDVQGSVQEIPANSPIRCRPSVRGPRPTWPTNARETRETAERNNRRGRPDEAARERLPHSVPGGYDGKDALVLCRASRVARAAVNGNGSGAPEPPRSVRFRR